VNIDMKLDVKNLSGEVKDSIDVSDLIFGVPFNEALVHQVLVGHLANRRVGTASTKTRSEVRGGGRKPWMQKHTGRARHGSIRSPQWRKGGITFGPKPRDYHHNTPVKMRRGAIRCLLAEKVRQGQITIVEELHLPQPKTKDMINLLNDLGALTKSLVVSGQPSVDLQRGCRNLEKVKSLPAATINTVDLLDYDHLVISVDGVRVIEKLWGQEHVRVKARKIGGGDRLKQDEGSQQS